MLSRVALALALAVSACGRQTPPLESHEMRATLQARAAQYPLLAVHEFGVDSVVLVFEDSTLAAAAVQAGTWMFGPPTSAAEAGTCPPEKVLGRRLARAYWRGAGRPTDLQQVTVRVQSRDRVPGYTEISMYYYAPELSEAWVGDPDQN